MSVKDPESLNKQFKSLTPEERLNEVYHQFDKVLFTTSLGATSIVLLHMLHKQKPGSEVFFIDTGYHFKETHDYKNLIERQFDLIIKSIQPDPRLHDITEDQELWNKDPDGCCYINKVLPLEPYKEEYDVWVSGLMGFQNDFRKNRQVFESGKKTLRCYPIIDMSPKAVRQYIRDNGLPFHPLTLSGYDSIGCTHCTAPGSGREGRWKGVSKTECGLHNDD